VRCSRCGNEPRDAKRLFELEPGVMACRWQSGCDDRIIKQEATIHRLLGNLEALSATPAFVEQFAMPVCPPCQQHNHIWCVELYARTRANTNRECYCACHKFL